jgi:K+-transporting ATPase ATPase A chain
MTTNDILQILFYLLVLLLSVKPLGLYMAFIYEDKPCFMNKILKPVERIIYRFCTIQAEKQMNWKEYTLAMLIFNFINIIIVYALQRSQAFLPLNPEHFPAVSPDLAFNTAVSFVTNTDWQAYGGENTLSYFTQMMALTVQNFFSAATAMSLLMAFIRGLKRQQMVVLGNFWVDLIRSILYILMPLAIVLALLLVSQGVIQNFKHYQTATLTQPVQYQAPLSDPVRQPIKDQQNDPTFKTSLQKEQLIPMGPVASQVAIKQLGTNGGGFFNVNSAHPFENPTPFSNFLEMLAILLIPAALCYSFGVLIQDRRQGWAILCTMLLIFLPLSIITIIVEQQGNHELLKNVAQILPTAGNMEGKETRLGVLNSSLWAAATTATGNGSVNAMLDSFMPMSGAITLLFLDVGEVIFGGVGSGLYQMLIFVIVTVFFCGLMVGRTPEYLGKKIEPYEMKMASIAILIMPLTTLICTAMSLMLDAGKSSIANPGAHGFTEILYAFSSMTNNNGSAFAGLNANATFYNTLGGVAILIGRYWIAIPILAIAGSLAKKKCVPISSGTLSTHTPLFIVILASVIVIMGVLTFSPALALGPIVEQLMSLEN